jgi:hypothetical protein
MGLKDNNKLHGCKDESLSETWRELLGAYTLEPMVDRGEEVAPTALADDPWSQLLHVQGVEMVDLQQAQPDTVHVSLSEAEMERVLQVMQEQPGEDNVQR